jgi:hypothetical protein
MLVEHHKAPDQDPFGANAFFFMFYNFALSGHRKDST